MMTRGNKTKIITTSQTELCFGPHSKQLTHGDVISDERATWFSKSSALTHIPPAVHSYKTTDSVMLKTHCKTFVL